MSRFFRKCMLGAGVLAVLSVTGRSGMGLCLDDLHCLAYADEFEVVPDEGNMAEQDAFVAPDQDEPLVSSDEDVFGIEGLIEVVEEHSDASGDSDQESRSGKDKKAKKLIAGFQDTGCISSIHFEMGEKPSLEQLTGQFPTQLDVYFQEEKKTVTVSVTWNFYSYYYSSTDMN